MAGLSRPGGYLFNDLSHFWCASLFNDLNHFWYASGSTKNIYPISSEILRFAWKQTGVSDDIAFFTTSGSSCNE